MLETKLVVDEPSVEIRLAEFNLEKKDIVRVALDALGARNEVTPFFPKTAAGTLAYHHGVDSLRRNFVPAGYRPVSQNNIESVYDEVNGRKIMFQTVDQACVKARSPLANSEIGPAKQIVIEESAQEALFPEFEAEERKAREWLSEYARAEAWYVCVAFSNDTVTCELSLPSTVENKQFAHFSERIFIIPGGPGGITGRGLMNLDDDAAPVEITPSILKR